MLFVNVPTDPDALVDQQAEDDAFYAATLREMVALGLEIGRIIHQQVVAQSLDSPHSPIDDQSSVSYDRIFRGVRRGILLAKYLKRPTPASRPSQARRQILREVGDRIDAQAPPEKIDRLYKDLRDRLDTLETAETAETIEDIANHPIPELIAQICKDLGLPPTITKPSPPGRGLGEGPKASTSPEPQTPQPNAPNPGPRPEPTGPPDPTGS